MFGGNIYGAAERRKKMYAVAMAMAILAALIFAWKSMPRSPISTSWDTGSIQPGDSAILRVTVTNNTDRVVKNDTFPCSRGPCRCNVPRQGQ